ncbi:MAG TPA: serine hydrolase domain-containing protein, partial [Vicinamibacterales bacterium]|nr:serine hydrolase domain-containing protein [Vicinamibacterales bacterium]
QKAYGMADLEHDAPNRSDTIFEAGSVSKQFTAAAVLLLAQDGKLSLDDPVRKYVPELPDYGAPLTIRHMLQHTSGLRDWGEIAAIAGWPRTSRVHTHQHVLDILSRQKALNFPSGTQYSYSNSGYNLAAILVSRVAGQSFADFSRERIFAPLDMTRTSWRDDHTRIVKGRAVAYSASGGSYKIEMPFENVHGNGGLLTTVGDLLKWNENFVSPRIGNAEFLTIQQEPGRFNDGKAHTYAMGLVVNDHRGVAQVAHSGSTAGYRAHLTRFPAERLSVAVLCNVSSGAATQYAMTISEMYLDGKMQPATTKPAATRQASTAVADPTVKADQQLPLGRFYSEEAEVTYEVIQGSDGLAIRRRPGIETLLRRTAADEYALGGNTVRFIRNASGQVTEMSLRGSRVFDLRFKKVD